MNSATEAKPAAPGRLLSIDAYRGFVMFLMMGEALSFGKVSAALPASHFWAFLDYHQSHVEWIGCSLHDLIQPSFSFLVGVALPFSLANRAAAGQPEWRMTLHAFWRAFLLVALGIFLRSVGRSQTNFTFEDTLTQIGLGYGFLYMLGRRSWFVQGGALAVILVGYWLAFALYPLPGPGFDWSRTGVAPTWEHNAAGFAAHWNKNTNLAWAFDGWFLNLFPRPSPFLFNGGGYATLSFIPTLGTMILGLMAGRLLLDRQRGGGQRIQWFVALGIAGIVAGAALSALGLCPNVKRIWTPSWTLFSGGCCFLLLAMFHGVIDLAGWRRWCFPLVVVGANSIAAYCMDHLFGGFIRGALRTHLGEGVFGLFGRPYVPLVQGALMLCVLWLILWWMYRKKLFLKV